MLIIQSKLENFRRKLKTLKHDMTNLKKKIGNSGIEK